MKQSVVTGEKIYETLKQLERELTEIEEGMDEVDGYDLPYKLLQTAYNEKLEILQSLRKQQWVRHG